MKKIFSGIHFKIRGKGKCKWVDFSKVKDKENVVCKNTSLILSDTSTIVKNVNHLSPGEHSFQFQYQLPDSLPSSFRGSHGYIKYTLKVIVDKSWHLKERYFIPITIIERVNIGRFHASSLNKVYRQITKTIGVFDSRPITLSAEIPVGYGVRDTEMELNVTVDNMSKNHIDKLKFSVMKIVTYFANQRLKKEEIKMFKKETGGIDKQTSRTFAYKLPVKGEPTLAIRFLQIAYEIRVHIGLNRILWNPMSVVLPFVIVTDPPPTFETPNRNSLPYPSAIQNVSIYSNSSIDSPSRSQYSNNDTISSITSNSSAATLSPGTFLRPHLNRSGASSARNSYRLPEDSSEASDCVLPSAPSDSLDYDTDSDLESNIGWNRSVAGTSAAAIHSTPRRGDLRENYSITKYKFGY